MEALVYAALAAANMLPLNVLVHQLASSQPAMSFTESLFLRSFGCFVLGLLACLFTRTNPFAHDAGTMGSLGFLGLLGSLGGLFLFLGLSRLPASEATALYASSPFWAMAFEWVHSREQVTRVAVVALLSCFLGICYLAQGPPTSDKVIDTAGEELGTSRTGAAVMTLTSAMLVGFIAPKIRK
eukprot:768423-Hanusia_phi.AAC.6